MPEPVPASPVSTSPVTVRVVPLAAGECLNLAALTQRGAAWRVQAYPAGFALLLHPSGPVLLDTGYGPQVPRLMRRWPGVLYGLITPVRLAAGGTAAAQLARMRLDVRSIKTVIVSHLHADHVGDLRAFPGARFVLDGAAYPPLRGLKGLRAVRRAFLPELLPPDFEARTDALHFAPAPAWLAPFAEAADIFADESVWAVRVPGHAPGMIALMVREAAAGEDGSEWTLLATDAAWNVLALRLPRGEGAEGQQGGEVHPLARIAFFDVEQERRSRGQLQDWLARYPRARVIVSHDFPESRLAQP